MSMKRSIIWATPMIFALAIFSPGMASQAFAASSPAKTVIASPRSEPADIQQDLRLSPSQEEGPGWTQGYIDGQACRDPDPGAYESFPDENFEDNYYAGYDEGSYEAEC
ncbi:hypothetical protein [Streptomyces carpinensis]|uniref:Secreted protein n=1 Tax=Streptomyces carpinensis TaxID=66369 RepID=A0ABV1VXQ6_9ACTN|nr:hypothetical protein [Streptomyces carpinensis]